VNEIADTSTAPATPALERERRIREALRERGYRSLAQAARAVDLDYGTMHRIVTRGLSSNPRFSTVTALQKLGIFELARQGVASTA
jgi:hypothetical protein